MLLFSVSLGSFGGGSNIAWTSPVFPHIIEEDCKPDCDIAGGDLDTISWIGTISTIGSTVSGAASYFLLRNFGRKKSIILLAIPFLIGFTMLSFTRKLDSIELLLVGRFFTGF